MCIVDQLKAQILELEDHEYLVSLTGDLIAQYGCIPRSVALHDVMRADQQYSDQKRAGWIEFDEPGEARQLQILNRR